MSSAKNAQCRSRNREATGLLAWVNWTPDQRLVKGRKDSGPSSMQPPQHTFGNFFDLDKKGARARFPWLTLEFLLGRSFNYEFPSYM
jgi:hypothetical protein